MQKQFVRKRKVAKEAVQPEVVKFNGSEIRVAVKDGKQWWALVDVYSALGDSYAVQSACHLTGVRKVKFIVGNRDVWFVNRAGLFRVLNKSQRLLAAKFKEWAFKRHSDDGKVSAAYPVRIDFAHGDGGRVDARELWKALQVKSMFPDWFKATDWSLIQKQIPELIPRNYENAPRSRGKTRRKDYWLTLEAAKEACATEKNSKTADKILAWLENVSKTTPSKRAKSLSINECRFLAAGTPNGIMVEEVPGKRYSTVFPSGDVATSIVKCETEKVSDDLDAKLERLLVLIRECRGLEKELQFKAKAMSDLKKEIAATEA